MKEKLLNIGPVISKIMDKAEINSYEKLKQLGSKKAFLKLREVDSTLCINVLYALEGAIQKIKDHSLSKETKADLIAFFRNLSE